LLNGFKMFTDRLLITKQMILIISNQYTKNKIGADGKMKLLLQQYEIRYIK
jgi:hypothetical protein